MSDLGKLYGREGEAIARYMGEGWSIPADCDLCQARLQELELAPQTLHWRTKPQLVSTEHKLFVTVETRKYYQQSGRYFLCSDCRKVLRPVLKEQLPRVLGVTAVAVPVGIVMGGELPLALKLVFPGLVLGCALLWQMRSRFRGYPANLGFRLHSTTFDGPEQRLIMPVFILLFLCLMLMGMLGGGSGVPTDLALGRMDGRGGTGTVRMAEIHEALEGLYKIAPEGRRRVGDMLVKGWALHKQRTDHLYPTTPEFIKAVTSLVPGGGTQAAVDRIAGETAGKRLARLQGSGDPVQLEVKVGRVASITHATVWEVTQAVETLAGILKQTGKPGDLTTVLAMLESQATPGRNLTQVTEAAQSELFAH